MTDYHIDAITDGIDGWVPTINGLSYGAELFPSRRAALENARDHAQDMKLDAVMRLIEREVGVPVLRVINGGLK